MYHMAMPPQYGGANPPTVHSTIFPGPLLPPVNHSHSLHLFPSQSNASCTSENASSASLHSSPIISQGSFYHQHQPSVYLNPYIGSHVQSPIQTSTVLSPHGFHNTSHNIGYGSSSFGTNLFHANHPNRQMIQNHSAHFQNSRQQPLTVDEELLEEMNTLHLGYLETEDSPQKMEQREKLEHIIMEYLAITPHSLKFMFKQIIEVLENSVMNKPNFNAHDAACAFDALAHYAANLISQPWRKEFREVKLHNGFWVHQVASHLIGAEFILELMGYVCVSSKGTLPSTDSLSFKNRKSVDYYVLQGVIDPDLIARLALDCMIAYCECQCLYKIKEGVAEYGLSWAQILQFRQLYMGGVDVTVRNLLFTLRQRMNPPPYSTPLSPETNIPNSPPPIPTRQSSSYAAAGGSSSVPYFPPSPKASSSTGPHSPLEMRLEVSSSVDESRSKSSLQHSPDHQKNTRSLSLTGMVSTSGVSAPGKQVHYRNNFSEDKSDGVQSLSSTSVKGAFSSRVPTAKLIDLDSSNENTSLTKPNHHLLPKVLPHHKSSSKSSSQQTPNRCSLPNDHAECPPSAQPPPEAFETGTFEEHLQATMNLVKNPIKNSGQTAKNSEGNSWETWDFVYRGLEKKGYTKDIGDRGDILHDMARQKNYLDATSPSSGKNLNLNMNNQRKDVSKNRPLTINQALHQLNLQETREKVDRPPSSKSSLSISHAYVHENHKRNSLYDNISGAGFETANQDSEDSEDSRRSNRSVTLKKINNAARQEAFNKAHESGSLSHKSSSNCSSKINDHTTKPKPGIDLEKFKKDGGKTWACGTCTYENKLGVNICEMCGKSKDPGPDSKPLESGGKQCVLCTLINDRNVEICSACGADLKGSSTYI